MPKCRAKTTPRPSAAFKALENSYKKDPEKAEKLLKLLQGQALLTAGLPLQNTAEFCKLVSELMHE